LSAGVRAHVNLLLPDGGEELVAGTVYTIVWTVTIDHALENWDLHYSTTGVGGPWIPIAIDLPAGDPSAGSMHTYEWTVPLESSNQVRVKIVQDNEITDYEDAGGADLAIVPATPLTTQEIATGLSYPVHLTAVPGDASRLFVVEQTGRIRIVKNGTLLSRPFLDIHDRVKFVGEQGLLGLVFHPDYANNGYFYVNYTAAVPEGQTVVSRFAVSMTDADSAVAASEFTILDQPQPYSNHNGGMIAFSPHDGYLYVGMGDGGAGGDPDNNAQSGDTRLGKILRVDVDGGSPYAIPNGNPFINDPNTLDEIWAIGVRNPWRWSFDRMTGDLWIADVGQGTWEEIDFQPFWSYGGENYGWRLKEGNHCYNPSSNCDPGSVLEDPIHEYDHVVGPYGYRCSITGGYVYRGCAVPDLAGTYFFGDYCTGEIWSLRYDGVAVQVFQDRTAEILGGNTFNISAFGQDALGELYVLDFSADGRVLKIVPDGVASLCVSESCCTGRVGDANGSGDQEPTIGDVSILIDAKFISSSCDGKITCLAKADVNQSGGPSPTCDDITIGDISIVIDYLFITGPLNYGPLADCQ
jgi:glucose/arabinose dehydrogenase